MYAFVCACMRACMRVCVRGKHGDPSTLTANAHHHCAGPVCGEVYQRLAPGPWCHGRESRKRVVMRVISVCRQRRRWPTPKCPGGNTVVCPQNSRAETVSPHHPYQRGLLSAPRRGLAGKIHPECLGCLSLGRDCDVMERGRGESPGSGYTLAGTTSALTGGVSGPTWAGAVS